MQNPDDKHIMDQIRSTLEEYQPQCTHQSWERMSALLDQQTAIPKSGKWKTWLNGFTCGIIISIIFMGSYYIFFYSNSNTIEQNKIYTATNSTSNTFQSNTRPNFKKQKLANSGIPELSESNLNSSNSSSIAQKINIEPEIIAKYQTRQVFVDEMEEQSKVPINDSGSIAIFVNTDIQPIQPLRTSSTGIIIKPVYEKELRINRNHNNSVIRLAKNEDKSRRKLFDWGKLNLSFNMQDDLYKNFIGPDRVKLGYSPELVFGSFQSKRGISQGAGIMLEGPISKGLSVGIGFYKRQYNWQNEKVFQSLEIGGSDTSKYVIDSIHVNKGTWNYFEVPIEIGLHFLHKDRSEIILNTSIAAVIMQSEKYQYDRIIGQTTNSQKKEPKPYSDYNIFGNLTLGLEYRYRLGERWNLWIEPYFKWYLKGVGDTPFKPKCFGVNVGLVYQFNLH
ncbi:MAG: hypothetical protein HOO91_21475 [Bacteroidales bacterium]|nr:hypothetical protein [Bacteroidales bacterium]